MRFAPPTARNIIPALQFRLKTILEIPGDNRVPSLNGINGQ
jgi:hypothetical protein